MLVEQKTQNYAPRQEEGSRLYRYSPENYHLWEHLPRARLLRVTPHGHEAVYKDTPPKKRSMVIALGHRQQIIIAFPYGNTELEGFHDYSEAWAINRLGRLRTWTTLHGSVSQSVDDYGNKTRTAYIYEASPEDKSIIKEYGSSLEQGKADPIKFLKGPDFIPERIMQVLCAGELRVIEGIASTSLYRLVKSHR